jgi:hypothetical protein
MFRLAGGFLSYGGINAENIHKKRLYDFVPLGDASRL